MTLEETYSVWMAKHPLTGELERLLNKKFTIEYNFNSNHIEGNTLTYGQTELLLLFGRVTGGSEVKDYADMKASQVGVEMVKEAVQDKSMPMTQNFIRQLHKVILREDYTVYRNLPGGLTNSYTIHAGQYKTRPVMATVLNMPRLRRPQPLCPTWWTGTTEPSKRVNSRLWSWRPSSITDTFAYTPSRMAMVVLPA